jgi:hypothetical protein
MANCKAVSTPERGRVVDVRNVGNAPRHRVRRWSRQPIFVRPGRGPLEGRKTNS